MRYRFFTSGERVFVGKEGTSVLVEVFPLADRTRYGAYDWILSGLALYEDGWVTQLNEDRYTRRVCENIMAGKQR